MSAYKVLLASPWKNEQTGQEGTTWTQVGRAFPTRNGDGFTIFIHAGLSVTGTLIVREDEEFEQARPPARQHPVTKQKKNPASAPSDAPLDDDLDIPF